MKALDPSIIDSWHAHVYFDASSRDAAWALRETIEAELAGRMEMGRFHERPLGPHPMWSYQLAFPAAGFAHNGVEAREEEPIERLCVGHGLGPQARLHAEQVGAFGVRPALLGVELADALQ